MRLLIAPPLNLGDPFHRVRAIIISIKLFGIIMLQADQLPPNYGFGHTASFANGTSIFYGDTFVQKKVVLDRQPELVGKEHDMQRVYDLVRGCNQIVQLARGSVSVKSGTYSVFLQPHGKALTTKQPPQGRSLIAATRCVVCRAVIWWL